MSHAPRHTGFTLIELMVSLAVLAVVTLYLTEMLTRQSRTYSVVDTVTEVQQNVRAIANLIERELRATAFVVPEAGALCGLDATTASDVLFVTDADAVRFNEDPDADLPSYEMGIPVNAGYSGTSNNDVLQLSDLTVDGVDTYDLDADGANDADFREGGGVVVVDRANPQRGSSCGIITQPPDTVGNSVTVDFRLASAAPGGTPLAPVAPGDPFPDVVAVPAHVYQVVGTQLFRDGLLLADDVEDLQFAAFYDADDDDELDPGEYWGTTSANRYVSSARNNSTLREIRVSFVVRSRAQDPEFGGPNAPQGEFQEELNRAAVPGTDRFRRRVYDTRVRPRNVGHR